MATIQSRVLNIIIKFTWELIIIPGSWRYAHHINFISSSCRMSCVQDFVYSDLKI